MANIVPFSCANFSTSLASAISSSATSLVLASITTDDGVILPTKTYGITVDQGTNSQEHMIATFSGTTTGTIVTRGVSVIDGTTNIPALQFSHSRGASVKFTDHPILIRMLRILEGTDTLDTKLSYTSHPTFTANTQIIDKKYADDLAIAGAPDASTTVKGIIEIATSAETAAGTAAGGTAALLVPANSNFNATSSAAVLVPVTNASGKISAGFGGSASTLATLNGSSLVVENPANATATATASKIPIADSSGTLNSWVTKTTDSTRTTGEAIDGSSTPVPVCIKASDGLIYKADANVTTLVQTYGFITTNASITTTPAVTVAGVVGGFTGLTAGANYYVSDTVGTISNTPSTTTIIPIGVAISTTQIALNFGKKIAFASTTHSVAQNTTENKAITIGFKASLIDATYSSFVISGSNIGNARAQSLWAGTVLKKVLLSTNTTTATAVTETSIFNVLSMDVSPAAIAMSSGGATNGTTTFTITPVSDTGFTSKGVNASAATDPTTGNVAFIAYE